VGLFYGAFHEAVTNQILEDLVAATHPRFMRLKAIFNVRGGVYTTIIAEHQQSSSHFSRTESSNFNKITRTKHDMH
jgi:NADPH-dependent 7-cyano-7-deazaguanine reductase QueF